MSPSGARGRRTLWKVVLVGGVLVAAFAGFDSLRLVWARTHQPTGTAEWIWGRQMQAPTAYFLLRDFSLNEAVEGAELQILADEAYTVYLNGARIGSNRFRAGAPVDRYDVSRYLNQGNNRITVLVELTRLRGGLLARIVASDGDGAQQRELVVTDDSWSVMPEFAGPRMTDPDFQLRPLPRARSLGRSPLGRWGWLELGPLRSVLEDHRTTRPGGGFLPPARAQWWRDQSRRWQSFGSGARSRRLGDWVEFSWDQPQTGYFGIRHAGRRPPIGLVYFGMAPPNPAVQAPDVVLVGVERRPTWEDTVVRRFQYVLVLGVPSIVSAQVHRVDIGEVEVWDPSSVGVLGVLPPAAGSRLRSAVEDEIWSRLQGISRSTGG